MEGLMSGERRHIREDDTNILRIERFVNVSRFKDKRWGKVSLVSFVSFVKIVLCCQKPPLYINKYNYLYIVKRN